MALALIFAAASHVGHIRSNNEDSAYAGPHLLALSDGMGGHAAGEIASQLMIRELSRLDKADESGEMFEQLLAAMTSGNGAIADEVDANPEREGMGCTLDAFLFRGDTLAICHVGDSRGYRLRDGILQQLTKDDTFVQSLVDEGKLAPEDVSSHPQRSLILKALTGRPVEPTLLSHTVRVGDRYLLCSDGLSDPVSADTIKEILSGGTIQEAVDKLIDLALRSGGPDNVTVVVGEILEVPEDEADAYREVQPLLVGAIDPDAVDVARPDTAASRAVGMQLTTGNSTPSTEDDRGSRQPMVVEPDESKLRRKKGGKAAVWVGIIALVLVIVGGLLYWARSTIYSHYYVSVAANDALVINRGAKDPVLGMTLNEVDRKACLSTEGKLSLLEKSANDSCHTFVLSDLPPALRTSVENLPSGSFADVQSQMERLAQEVLPVCVSRATSEATTSSDTNRPGDLLTPGVSCRAVDQ